MDAPSWHRIKDIVSAALERVPAERARFVLERCGDDHALRSEVESLLAATEQAGSFIERPAFQSLAPTVHRALHAGDSVGSYEVLGFLGAGGMGEVYQARDAKLNRHVALKVPSDAFALDVDRLARFKREAHVLALLNHPNIAAIYGLEESGGVQALVLELVDGPTLDSRIAHGSVPIDEALSIAKQIAEGLKAAHERGIIHRDLKPCNIKLRADGTVKILDFGLAKALSPPGSGSSVSAAAAITSPSMTHAGVIFGTAQYMSPEQVRGKVVDKRADIWAFGCVLYETLTGERTFRGETIQDTLAAVLGQEPDWSALPAGTPAGVVKLLHRCLEKDPDRRLHDIADARIEIEDAAGSKPFVGPNTRRVYWAVAAVAVVAIAVVVWGWLRPADPVPAAQTVRRLLIGLPPTQPLARARSMPLGDGQVSLAISPDGTHVAYVMERQDIRQLYLHALDQLEGTPIPQTDGAFGPFFSPDGRWIGFFAGNKLKKVAVSGGNPIDLCAAPNPYGGSWGTDGTILFAADEGRRPMRIPYTGGVPQPVAIKDDRGSWTQPHLLPGGKSAIVSHTGGVGVLSLDTGEYRTLFENGADGRYAPTGHLVFGRGGALLAAPFDLERLVVNGPATAILEGVRAEGVRAVAQAAFSRDGTLIYVPGSAAANDATRPVWVDRRGKVQPVGMPPRSYRSFSLSPDGRRLAITIADPENDIWVQDLERGSLTKLTSGGTNVQPIWTPDGNRVVFIERTGGGATPFWVPADGSGPPERMFKGDHQGGAKSFSPDGQLVAFQRRSPDTGLDLWVRPVDATQNEQPFLRTRFTEAGPEFSPDGRWISYGSDESGQSEVYVRPYPGPGGKWQVSIQGGVHQIWSRDGKELFYRNGQKWMVVAVNLKPEFTASTPRLLFEGPYVIVGGQSYDVTQDGQRFLLLEPVEREVAPVTHLNVVLNWFEEVKQKTGTGLLQGPR